MSRGSGLFVVKLGTISLSEARERLVPLPIAMTGEFWKGAVNFSITEADVRAMAANFSKIPLGGCVIDYEHASNDPAVGDRFTTAGWVERIRSKPDKSGVVWGDAYFMEDARKMIAAGEYKYGSPCLDWGVRDRPTGKLQGLTLKSFALTNKPVLDRLPPIRLSEGWRYE